MSDWTPPGPGDRVLLVAPHPDDECLAAAGLLRRALTAGALVRVLFATNGERNSWVQRLVERRFRIGDDDRARFGARRRSEALAALATLGVEAGDVAFLGLPDCGLTDAVRRGDARAPALFAREIARWKPTLLVSPSASDIHPDHSAIAVLLRRALAQGLHVPQVEYVVHRRSGRPHPRADIVLALTTEERARKCAALRCHRAPMTVHRREFLARADMPEVFSRATEPAVRSDGHSVHAIQASPTGLRIEIGSRACLGAFGPATLYLAPATTSEAATRQQIAGHGRGLVVEVPRADLPAGPSVFVKVERDYGFFDESGWVEVQTAPRTQPATDTSAERSRRSPVVCAVIPCFNVATLCGPVIREAARHANVVYALDDGSTDGTAATLEATAAQSGSHVRIFSFPTNRGKGAVLLDGFRQALTHTPFDVLVTLDGDGQHRPSDIPALVAAWQRGSDLVIGARGEFEAMPFRNRLGNSLTAIILQRFHPGCPTDTQSGLRAHDRRFVEEVVASVEGRRYETELDILLLAMERRRRVVSVPIPTLYLDRNRSSHFRPLVDSVRIYRTLFGRMLRGAEVSIGVLRWSRRFWGFGITLPTTDVRVAHDPSRQSGEKPRSIAGAQTRANGPSLEATRKT